MISKEDADDPITKKDEWRAFIFITVVCFPLLACTLVGGYGFSIWMMQLMTGPLGAP